MEIQSKRDHDRYYENIIEKLKTEKCQEQEKFNKAYNFLKTVSHEIGESQIEIKVRV